MNLFEQMNCSIRHNSQKCLLYLSVHSSHFHETPFGERNTLSHLYKCAVCRYVCSYVYTSDGDVTVTHSVTPTEMKFHNYAAQHITPLFSRRADRKTCSYILLPV